MDVRLKTRVYITALLIIALITASTFHLMSKPAFANQSDNSSRDMPSEFIPDQSAEDAADSNVAPDEADELSASNEVDEQDESVEPVESGEADESVEPSEPVEPDMPTAFSFMFDTLNKSVTDTITESVTRVNKTLPVNWDLIGRIGNQVTSGHTICCPGFACAYADSIIDGTVNGHGYYGCGTCVWRNWGGGNSAFRSLGSSQQLLREAYEEIRQGRPTVLHVAASYGEHWVTVFGYQNVENPDSLSLSNFIAIDPWDSSVVTISNKFVLYGDNCEHISSR